MAAKATAFDRVYIFPGLILADGIGALLLLMSTTKWMTSPMVTLWIQTHRSGVGISVQVISALLGLILVQSICKCSRFC
jgi:hypothetical protein